MKLNLLRKLAAVSVIGVAVTGIVLILIALLYRRAPHAVLWYLQGGTVYRYDTEKRTTEAVRLPSRTITSARLSPDSSVIAFSDQEGLKIAISPFDAVRTIAEHKVSIDGSKELEQYKLTTTYVIREWSPDSQSVFVEEWGWDVFVYRMSMATAQLEPLPSSTVPTMRCSAGLSWSSDSRKFVIPGWGLGICPDAGGVIVASIEDADFRRIYYETIHADSLVFEGGVTYAAWSPTEDLIAFVQAADFQSNEGYRWKLMTVRTDGTQAQTLVDTTDDELAVPIWSPNGTELYYLLRRRENSDADIYSVNLRSHTAKKLYSASSVRLSSISPDGKWLTFVNDEGVLGGDILKTNVRIMNLSNKEVIQVNDTEWNIGSADIVGWELMR